MQELQGADAVQLIFLFWAEQGKNSDIIQKNQVNITYTWYDSFTKQKKMAQSPMLDAISSLYNYAVASYRIACYMDIAGDGIKEASLMF